MSAGVGLIIGVPRLVTVLQYKNRDSYTRHNIAADIAVQLTPAIDPAK